MTTKNSGYIKTMDVDVRIIYICMLSRRRHKIEHKQAAKDTLWGMILFKRVNHVTQS